MKLLFHIVGKITTIDGRGRLHAAADGAQVLLARGRRMVPTVCGLHRTRPVGMKAVDATGERIGQITMLWPPRLSTLPEGLSRCRTCYVQTGRPRPAPGWSETAELHA